MKRQDLHLVLGSLSLTLAGFILRETGARTGLQPSFWLSLPALLEALATSALLVVSVYGFNRLADPFFEARAQGRRLSAAERAAGARTAGLVVVSSGALAFLATRLGDTARGAAVLIFLLGIAYSVGFGRARPKNVFVLKNVLIALPWGLLVVVGAGGMRPGVPTLVTFASMQVFVGSVLRDLDDTREDRSNGVTTLPVKLGVTGTLAVLRLVNAASVAALLAAVFMAPRSVHPIAAMLTVAATYRACALWWLHRRGVSGALLRAGNLATCHLILVAVVVTRLL